MKKNNWLKLFLKNSFLNLLKNINQLSILTIILSVWCLFISLTSIVNVRFLNNHNDLISKSNLHNAVLVLNKDEYDQSIQKEFEKNNNHKLNISLQDLTIKKFVNEQKLINFNWTRNESRTFQQIYNNGELQKLKLIAKSTNNVSEEVDKVVTDKNGSLDFKYGINNLRSVIIDPIYSKKHNIELNDIIRVIPDQFGNELLVKDSHNITDTLLNDLSIMKKDNINKKDSIYNKTYSSYNWFQVVSFGNSADFTCPIIDKNSPIPNKNSEGLIFINYRLFGIDFVMNNNLDIHDYNLSNDNCLSVTSEFEREISYSLKFQNDITEIESQKYNDWFNQHINSNTNKKRLFSINDKDYEFINRTYFVEKFTIWYNLCITTITFSLLIVIIYTIILLVKKQVINSRAQLGILVLLGYNKYQLIPNYLMVSLFSSLFGGIIGYILSIFVSNSIIDKLSNYFVFDYGKFVFDWISFFNCIFVIWVLLSILTSIIVFSTIRHGGINLINSQNKNGISKFGIWLKKLVTRKSFNSKIKGAIISSSGTKMIGFSIVILFSAITFTISYIFPHVININQDLTFNNIKYNQIVEIEDPIYNNPYSFSKTYNDSNTQEEYNPWKNIDNDLYEITSLPILEEKYKYDYKQIEKDYLNNNISAKYYTSYFNSDLINPPQIGMSNSRMLQSNEIIMTTNYIKRLVAENLDSSPLSTIILTEWPDYVNFATDLGKIDWNNGNYLKNYKDVFALFQNFYNKYKESVGLNINRKYLDNEKYKSYNKDYLENKKYDFNEYQKNIVNLFNENQLFKKEMTKSDSLNISLMYQLLNNENNQINTKKTIDKILNIPNEIKLENFNFKLNDNNFICDYKIIDDDWNKTNDKDDKFSRFNVNNFTEEDIDVLKEKILSFIGWFEVLIAGKDDQGILQAIYSRSPYFIKQNLKKSYISDQQYSISFNVMPFDNNQEELGTYINSKYQDENFQIFGIKSNKYIDLINSQNVDLYDKLKNNKTDKNPIIINRSLAEKFNLYEGQKINFSKIQKELTINNKNELRWEHINNLDSANSGYISNIKLGISDPSSEQKISIYNKKDNNELLAEINGTSSILFPDARITDFFDKYNSGNIKINKIDKEIEYTIIGINNIYGESRAWINYDDANEILKYNANKEHFWKLFAQQWNNHWKEEIGKNIFTDFKSYEEFLNWNNKEKQESKEKILKIFDNSFPIYNFKFSNKNNIGDLDKGYVIYSSFGDYSPITLNGCSEKNIDGIAVGQINNIIPIQINKQILNQISALVMLFLAIILVLIISISADIMLLTITIIINDNERFISTMKVLGYSNLNISRIVFSIYFAITQLASIIGFIIGYAISYTIIHNIYNIVVLPFEFTFWMPIITFLSISLLFVIVAAVKNHSINKINPIVALKESEL